MAPAAGLSHIPRDGLVGSGRIQGFSQGTKCSDSVQVGSKHSYVLCSGCGWGRVIIKSVPLCCQDRAWGHTCKVLGCLRNDELFLFAQLNPKEVNHKRKGNCSETLLQEWFRFTAQFRTNSLCCPCWNLHWEYPLKSHAFKVWSLLGDGETFRRWRPGRRKPGHWVCTPQGDTGD